MAREEGMTQMSDLDDLANAARQESASYRPSAYRRVAGPGVGFWVFVIAILALVGAPLGYAAWRDHASRLDRCLARNR